MIALSEVQHSLHPTPTSISTAKRAQSHLPQPVDKAFSFGSNHCWPRSAPRTTSCALLPFCAPGPGAYHTMYLPGIFSRHKQGAMSPVLDCATFPHQPDLGHNLVSLPLLKLQAPSSLLGATKSPKCCCSLDVQLSPLHISRRVRELGCWVRWTLHPCPFHSSPLYYPGLPGNPGCQVLKVVNSCWSQEQCYR